MTGKKVARVEIDQAGKIILVLDNGGAPNTSNSLDSWMATRADANQGD
jgi:hypothetical protein